MELPDWLRGIVLIGRSGAEYRVVGVDDDGYLGVILQAAAEVTIPGDVSVDQNDSIREMQGADGPTLRTVAVDANGQIIMVPRGSTGNYMSVDANGFMSTVIKGIYGATLKTLATDDEGNMIALLKDTDDQWGNKVSVGIGELAARLGSPMNWDKRGQVVRIETFADGFGAALTGVSGTGALVILQPTVFQMGGYSCQLTTGTTVNRSATVTIYSDYSPSGRIGLEAVFSMVDQPDNINITATIWTGVYNYTMGSRLNKATGQLQVYNSAAAWVNVTAYSIPAVPQVFFSVKIVLDLDTQYWVRMLAKGAEFDLSAIEAKRVLSGVHPYITFSVQAKEDAAVSHTIYVDRMIITTNEP